MKTMFSEKSGLRIRNLVDNDELFKFHNFKVSLIDDKFIVYLLAKFTEILQCEYEYMKHIFELRVKD